MPTARSALSMMTHALLPVSSRRRIVACLAACAALAGCAAYRPEPLPATASLSPRVTALRVDTARIDLPPLAGRHIDLGAPLDIDAVAALAVLNDPRLRAARDAHGVAQAQAFAAGLLPDPQFGATRDFPQGHSTATTSAYSLSLGLDLGRLITRPAAVAAARADLKSVDMQILWLEWQTAAAAQLAYVRLVGLEQRDALLRRELGLVDARRARDLAAVAAGNLPRTSADADLVEQQALQARLGDDRKAALQQQAELDTMLGLQPTVRLRLAGQAAADPAALAQARQALDHLGRIRPDLMALRAGSDSQEQRVREAVLAQFPSVSVGFTRARDTSDVHTLGFGVGFSLPIFDGSRGAIAVARATRTQLRDDYRQRLATTTAEVQQAMADIALLREQDARLRAALPTLQAAARGADAALAAGDLTLPQAQAQRTALLEQRLAVQSNAQQLAEQAVALQLLTGRGIYRPAARE